MTRKKQIDVFRKLVEETYRIYPTGCGGSFGEILCFELHTQPVNPRMGLNTGLTFKELAEKWGISLSFLGDLISDHCKKL